MHGQVCHLISTFTHNPVVMVRGQHRPGFPTEHFHTPGRTGSSALGHEIGAEISSVQTLIYEVVKLAQRRREIGEIPVWKKSVMMPQRRI